MKRCVTCDRLLVHDHAGVDTCTWCWVEAVEDHRHEVFMCQNPEAAWIADQERENA